MNQGGATHLAEPHLRSTGNSHPAHAASVASLPTSDAQCRPPHRFSRTVDRRKLLLGVPAPHLNPLASP